MGAEQGEGGRYPVVKIQLGIGRDTQSPQKPGLWETENARGGCNSEGCGEGPSRARARHGNPDFGRYWRVQNSKGNRWSSKQ